MARTSLPGKWTGLGINLCTDQYNDADPASWDSYISYLRSKGFTNFRVSLYAHDDEGQTKNKAAVVRAVAGGANVTWGVDSSSGTLDSTEWTAYHSAILTAAQWAQDNGVSEFQLGNEREHWVGGDLSVTQFIANIKSTAAECQEIFTNGPISYTPSHWFIQNWVDHEATTAITPGTNLDRYGMNLYINSSGDTEFGLTWQEAIDLVNTTWGPTKAYITEFSVNSNSWTNYSANELMQANGLSTILEYIKTSGLDRATFFVWNWLSGEFGIITESGDPYKDLWYTVLLGERLSTDTRTTASTRSAATERVAS